MMETVAACTLAVDVVVEDAVVVKGVLLAGHVLESPCENLELCCVTEAAVCLVRTL